MPAGEDSMARVQPVLDISKMGKCCQTVVFAAPPCSTFSVARLQISNGPPQLRSRMHPRGIPGLSPPDQEQVERHNDLVGVMLSLMYDHCCKDGRVTSH